MGCQNMTSYVFSRTPNDGVSVKEVVILSSSFNLRYIFLLPFAASLWKKLGVQPIIILIGEKSIIRLFGAILPLPGYSISDETIFITSDADLAVFNRSNHIPSLKNQKTIHLYNSNCCESVNVPPNRGNYAVKMYPMGTIGATRQTWKNIMGFKKDVFNIDEIEEYVQKEFGTQFFNPSDDTNTTLIGSSIWYSDQSLFSYKFDEWMEM
uniref:Uncharacterized protein n=1 Tax=Panagrolaimus davidi TaxID=227884 RepID=A0A914QXM2_9BILA